MLSGLGCKKACGGTKPGRQTNQSKTTTIINANDLFTRNKKIPLNCKTLIYYRWVCALTSHLALEDSTQESDIGLTKTLDILLQHHICVLELALDHQRRHLLPEPARAHTGQRSGILHIAVA